MMTRIIRNTIILFAFAASTAVVDADMHQVGGKKVLTLDGAKTVAAAAVQYAKTNNAPGGVLAIVDDGGQLIYLERLDNTFPAGAMVSYGKARTSALFRKPTKVFEDAVKNGRTVFLAAPETTPLQGGVPIETDGQVIGAIGVSGASSAQQDEDIAMAGAMALK
jgi:glc operon protein GlcG